MKRSNKIPHKIRILSAKNPIHVIIKTHLKISLQDCASLKKLRTLIGEVHRRYGVYFFQYVIQKNHIHFFLQAISPQAVSDAMRFLNSKLALYWNRRLGRSGKFWGDRFFSAVKASAKEIIRTIFYLANQKKYLLPYENVYSSICQEGEGGYPWGISPNILQRIGVSAGGGGGKGVAIKQLMGIIESATLPYANYATGNINTKVKEKKAPAKNGQLSLFNFQSPADANNRN